MRWRGECESEAQTRVERRARGVAHMGQEHGAGSDEWSERGREREDRLYAGILYVQVQYWDVG